MKQLDAQHDSIEHQIAKVCVFPQRQREVVVLHVFVHPVLESSMNSFSHSSPCSSKRRTSKCRSKRS